MFIDTLSRTEKSVLLQLLIWMADADEDVGPAEAAAIDDLRERLGLAANTPDLILNAQGVDALCAQVARASAKRVILSELVALAKADQHFAFVEKRALGGVAHAFGVEPEALAAIEAWVEDGLTWRARAREVLALGD